MFTLLLKLALIAGSLAVGKTAQLSIARTADQVTALSSRLLKSDNPKAFSALAPGDASPFGDGTYGPWVAIGTSDGHDYVIRTQASMRSEIVMQVQYVDGSGSTRIWSVPGGPVTLDGSKIRIKITTGDPRGNIRDSGPDILVRFRAKPSTTQVRGIIERL